MEIIPQDFACMGAIAILFTVANCWEDLESNIYKWDNVIDIYKNIACDIPRQLFCFSLFPLLYMKLPAGILNTNATNVMSNIRFIFTWNDTTNTQIISCKNKLCDISLEHPLLTEIGGTKIVFRACIIMHAQNTNLVSPIYVSKGCIAYHRLMWNVITHPCYTFQSPLNLGHVWVIT